ncbi:MULTISPECIES: hypothetical protein [unclassified Spirillospora]|uniref:hypothetical protein n=1 Tax=unclassified Spirillospora TaxID=2642701 RepID=UPI003713E9CA
MNAMPYEPAAGEPESTDTDTGAQKALRSVTEWLHNAGDQLDEPAENLHSLGRARKVSVSLPEELTAAVQQRVGKGEFSRYVTEAVAHQLELDLLAELSTLLEDEHGPIPEEYLAQAGNTWPDE